MKNVKECERVALIGNVVLFEDDEKYINVLKKQMFLPKMNIGEKIFTEKKDPNNPNFTQREFLLIVDISYNATTKQMIYTCQK